VKVLRFYKLQPVDFEFDYLAELLDTSRMTKSLLGCLVDHACCNGSEVSFLDLPATYSRI
jgi:hypothetical protein